MKVAVVSISMNEDLRLNQWIDLFNEYKDDCYIHIIVDNNSNLTSFENMKRAFSKTIFIRNKKNLGFNVAHNIGIKYVIENTDCDAILYIGTDFKLSKNAIREMYLYLKSDASLGVVSPVELDCNSHMIVNFGHTFNGIHVSLDCKGQPYDSVKHISKYTDMIEGGCHMMSIEYARVAGFYDEKMFMYTDELETSFKAQIYNYKLGVTGKAYCEHRHINNINGKSKRLPFSMYLISRNRIYLAKKYCNFLNSLQCFFGISLKNAITHFGKGLLTLDIYYIRCGIYSLLGGLNGMINNMNLNQFCIPKEK